MAYGVLVENASMTNTLVYSSQAASEGTNVWSNRTHPNCRQSRNSSQLIGCVHLYNGFDRRKRGVARKDNAKTFDRTIWNVKAFAIDLECLVNAKSSRFMPYSHLERGPFHCGQTYRSWYFPTSRNKSKFSHIFSVRSSSKSDLMAGSRFIA